MGAEKAGRVEKAQWCCEKLGMPSCGDSQSSVPKLVL
jgi:hypothetical protein